MKTKYILFNYINFKQPIKSDSGSYQKFNSAAPWSYYNTTSNHRNLNQ